MISFYFAVSNNCFTGYVNYLYWLLIGLISDFDYTYLIYSLLIGGNCITEANLQCGPSDSSWYLHPTDCTKFLRCALGFVTVENCALGTKFDLAASVCTWTGSNPCFCQAP